MLDGYEIVLSGAALCSWNGWAKYNKQVFAARAGRAAGTQLKKYHLPGLARLLQERYFADRRDLDPCAFI
jgi:hypothetical protein